MAIIGIDISRLFDAQVDKAYSGYLDPPKKNRLIKKSLTELVEKKYRGLDTQQEYDELSSMIVADFSITPVNGKVAIAPYPISSIIYNPSGLLTITTGFELLLIVGNQVTISNVSGITPSVNGAYTVLSVSGNTFTVQGTPGYTGTYVPNSGSVVGGPMITNYHHLLSTRCEYLITSRYITAKIIRATNASPIVITTERKTDIRSFTAVSITGVNGNTNANGVWFVKRYSYDTFALYQDAELTIPVVGNGTYVNGGHIGSFLRRAATQLVPDSKGNLIPAPTFQYPTFQMSLNKLIFSPEPSRVIIDYMADLPIQIDVLDTTTDYTLWYPEKLIFRLVNEAARQFNLESRDLTQYQAQAAETIQNP
jgi:hypothetical protein